MSENFDWLSGFIERAVPELFRKRLLELHEHFRPQIETMPGAVHHHHWWEGGYAQHVREVCDFAYTFGGGLVEPDETGTLALSAYVHDLDKLFRYERGSKPPTEKQISYARSLGVYDPRDSGATVSAKISAAKGGRPYVAEPEKPFRYIEGMPHVSEAARVVSVLAGFGIVLPDLALHAVTLHHGGWSQDYMTHPARGPEMLPIAVVLHCADLTSSHILGKKEPKQETAQQGEEPLQ